MLSKKGASKILVGLVIAMVVIVLSITLVLRGYRTTTETAEKFSPNELKSGVLKCRFEGVQGIYSSTDSDDSPDYCDICQGGDDRQDIDGDGIPDACDKNVRKAGLPSAECKGEWNSDLGMCCLDGFKHLCKT